MAGVEFASAAALRIAREAEQNQAHGAACVHRATPYLIKAEKNFQLWWLGVRFTMGEIHPSRYSESSIETTHQR
jgi:hypothetical protein